MTSRSGRHAARALLGRCVTRLSPLTPHPCLLPTCSLRIAPCYMVRLSYIAHQVRFPAAARLRPAAALRRATALDPSLSLAHFYLADAYARTGALRQALDAMAAESPASPALRSSAGDRVPRGAADP